MNSNLNLNELLTIQVELTTYCNSSCIGCARNNHGGASYSWLPLIHIDLSVWAKIVDAIIQYNIPRVYFNGSYGDSIMNPNLIDMLSMITNSSSISLATNGGVRDSKFWKDLALVLSSTHQSSHVTFAIDGLKDTNDLYRRGVDWNRLMENVQTFIDAGGNAKWSYIVFEHNAHQVEEAAKLAKSLGFKIFATMPDFGKGKRSLHGVEYRDYKPFTVKGVSMDQIQHFRDTVDFKTIVFPDKDNFESKCPWQRERKIQIGVDGSVHPCCYYGTELSSFEKKFKVREYDNDPIMDYYNTNGRELYNLHHYTLEEIMESEPFKKILPDMVHNYPSDICRRICCI
jgi:MoaA/NifB/PqqE/SkfB family radical SAM enzyme